MLFCDVQDIPSYGSCESAGVLSLCSLDGGGSVCDAPIPCMAEELEQQIRQTEYLQRRQSACDSHRSAAVPLVLPFLPGASRCTPDRAVAEWLPKASQASLKLTDSGPSPAQIDVFTRKPSQLVVLQAIALTEVQH